MTPAWLLAERLGGRRSGSGWLARCPAHDDRTPSLSIDDRDGRVLVLCRAGCSQLDVLAALRERGLWETPGAATARVFGSASARRAVDRAGRSRWLSGLAELRRAQGDVLLLRALVRDDPDERDPRTTALLDEIGDAYLREQIAEQRLDEIEREDRARREGVRRAAA